MPRTLWATAPSGAVFYFPLRHDSVLNFGSLRFELFVTSCVKLCIITVMSRNALLLVGGILLVAIFGFQASQISTLKRELAAVKTEISAPSGEQGTKNAGTNQSASSKATGAGAAATPRAISQDGAGLQARLTSLERSVAEFDRIHKILSDRGMMPPTEEKMAELRQKLFDPNATDEERLNALRQMRRGGDQLSDDTIVQSLAMLQSSTNANFRRELLQHLQGSSNPALKQPLMSMLDTESDQGMREQLVNSLRRFTDDPAVEKKMWDLALNEPNTRVRDQAREAVARGPNTPERIDSLSARASSPDASLDERLIAFRGLRLAKSHTPELVNDFASMAANTTDPVAKAKLFKSFNGLTDPVLLSPLVNGLQDTDPIVRQNAVDSLSEFPDPRVADWLTHLIQNDTDPTVKREAHAALERIQRLGRTGPPGAPGAVATSK